MERGDKVAATARKPETLNALVEKFGAAILPIQLDVTDRSADFAAVKKAADHFGRLDIVVVDAEKPPLRIFFGKTPMEIATKDYESRMALWKEWQPVSLEAHGK